MAKREPVEDERLFFERYDRLFFAALKLPYVEHSVKVLEALGKDGADPDEIIVIGAMLQFPPVPLDAAP